MHAACCVTRVITVITKLKRSELQNTCIRCIGEYVHLLLAAVMHLTNWEIDCDQIL